MSLLTWPGRRRVRSRQSPLEKNAGKKQQAIWLVLVITPFLPGLIIVRLAYLQLVKGNYYQERAEDNRIRIVPKAPVRGTLFDRQGRVLATTRLSHVASIWPNAQKKPTWPKTSKRLSEILGISQQELAQKVAQGETNPSTLIRIARNLTPAQITALEEYKNGLSGVEVDIDTIRYYPNKEIASHVLGYTGELDAEGLKQRKVQGYRPGDVVGKMGVEDAFEPLLRGEWGGLQMEVNGAGKVTKILGQKPAKPGKDVTLTLDLAVQKAAEKALGNYKGAIVALDPKDGAILAMASNPNYDPNVFSRPITSKTWKSLQKSGNPFLNRSLRGFPPASTFKVVTQTAGMQSGKYPPGTMLSTSAYLNVGGTNFGEWNKAGFGVIGYITALSMSSNTFHGQIGRGVGGETLIKWAHLYGFGQKTGIELADEESKGLIADDAWKKKNYKLKWTDGDSVNMSIGQGFVQATPLQIAVMFAVPANGGYRVTPHLLKNQQKFLKARKSLHLKPTTISTLRQGLRGVVTNGTGRALDVPYLPPLAGKSGTAEAPPGKTHTWFGAFAPFNKPEIVVVAFAEHSGGGGGKIAGPMVRQVLEAYFHKKNPETQRKPSK